MTTPPAPRLIALDAKLSMLAQETAAWRRDSATPASPFALHQSQIREVGADLGEMHALIAAEVTALRKLDTPPIADIERLERRILAALQIWESYRAKWALRAESDLRLTLDLLDDLAWHAYRPAQEAAALSGWLPADRVRLPPLVFTNPRWSPFARSRERAYELDEGSGVLRDVDDFEPFLRCMPVPLIGVPWTLPAHLPDAVFIGHEVGHLIEEDLQLDGELRQGLLAALADAPEQRRQAWSRHWRSEVFADLWGVLCGGPAYARLLVELLDGADDIALESQPNEQGRFSDYPTRALRAALLVEALRQVGDFSAEADALEARWRARHPTHAMETYVHDVAKVVRALLGGAHAAFAPVQQRPGRPVSTLLTFSADMHRQAQTDAKRALNLREPLANDVRVLFAGMTLAFLESAEEFRRQGVQARFVSRLKARRAQGVRTSLTVAYPAAQDRAGKTAARLFALLDARAADRT